jgi:nucleoside-diphosphate-sugar epimerase
MEPLKSSDDYSVVQGDIRDAGALTHAMRDCEAVFHTIAYHGVSLDSRNYDDYYGVNATGTHNVLRAMLLNDVKALVFSSSDMVYGEGMRGKRVMDESVPTVPNNIYALTKMLGEDMCRYYARKHSFNIAILRYGCFLPADWKMAGLGRLNNWLDKEDAAQANELALGAVLAEDFACETFLIQSAKPFADEDWPELGTNPDAVIERYYPGTLELLATHHLHLPRVHLRYNIDKAITRLGYDPQYNFEQFLSQLRRS